MTCVHCGTPDEWRGPSPITGREQSWHRHLEQSRRGPRCADRNACANRAAHPRLELFA